MAFLQRGDKLHKDALAQAERLVRDGEERVTRVRFRIAVHENAGRRSAAAAARDTLMILETTLQLMHDNLRIMRKARGLDP